MSTLRKGDRVRYMSRADMTGTVVDITEGGGVRGDRTLAVVRMDEATVNSQYFAEDLTPVQPEWVRRARAGSLRGKDLTNG